MERLLKIFEHQYTNNKIYKDFCDKLHKNPSNVHTIKHIPFLPISFFKSHKVVTGNKPIQLHFESSGTTGENTSKHYVTDCHLYETNLLAGFEDNYGSVADYAILALLPSYLERTNASLVHMAKTLMAKSKHSANGFYLHEWNELAATIKHMEKEKQKTILLGVTFALLDFAEAHPMQLNTTIVMETGGMKGRREEWTRKRVHEYLKEKWAVAAVHSEYGMTELLSQAYAKKDGLFVPTKTMQVLVRDMNDPLEINNTGTGCLNIIDTANINSCCFVATDDIGTVNADGSFEVLGRADHAALRGCSLLTA
jgi:phenylacetate-coenzyme A ligase PaaK-like adenylate-forming protein